MVMRWAWVQSPAFLHTDLGQAVLLQAAVRFFWKGHFYVPTVQQGAHLCVQLPRYIAKTQCLCDVGFAQGAAVLQRGEHTDIQ